MKRGSRKEVRTAKLLAHVLLFLAVSLPGLHANQRFDPDADESITRPKNCSIPPLQDTDNYIKPDDGAAFCQLNGAIPLSSLSDAQIHQVAETYAPVLFFHPLDEYSLEDATVPFIDPANGQIYRRPDGENEEEQEPILIDPTLDVETLLEVSKPDIENGDPYFFEHDLTDEYKRGAGYDYTSLPNNQDNDNRKVGLARAPIYYNALDTGNGTWVINYFFYYTWNGPHSLGIGLGQRRYAVLQIPPYGEHEGEWESMSVLICSSSPSSALEVLPSGEPLAVTYQAHSFSQITDCTKGECIFFRDSYHPVGFVSLNSHATYPISSRNHVYYALPFNFLYFAPGFFFYSDQTVYKSDKATEDYKYRMFSPNSTNLILLKDPKDIIQDQSLRSEYWQAFGGLWGETRITGVQPPRKPIICINRDQTKVIPCPKIPLLNAIIDFLGSFAAETLGGLVPAIKVELQRGNGPTGPARKPFFKEWLPPESAILWDGGVLPIPCLADLTEEESFCKWLGDPVDDVDSDYDTGLVAGIVTFTFSTATVISNVGRFFVDLCTGGPLSS